MGLNPQQEEAVKHGEGPLLVLAGAGSGKTRIITFRIAHLIAQGVPPHQILAVTFTNKAAGEMQERIHAHMAHQNLGLPPTICTFHSLGAKILRQAIDHLGYASNFVIYDEEDSNKLLKSCLKTLELKEESHVKSLRDALSTLKNQLLSPSDIIENSESPALRRHFAAVYQLYQERLKEANAVDFDDLLFLPIRLFQEHPSVLEHYQLRWRFLLIDEYQDTNQAQYQFARLIIAKHRNLFVVGDPDQSIYSWRGANIHNILNFEKDYPGAKVIRLEQNYRSRDNILKAASALISRNQHRLEKNLWSTLGTGETIIHFTGRSEHEEAQFVTQEIEKLHRLHRIPYKEIAIFYRTNFQSRLFEDSLLRRKIPYVIVGGISFYHRKEIKDLLAFLHILESPNDAVAFTRTLNLPKRGIGEVTIDRLIRAKRPFIELCQDPDAGIRLSAKQKEALLEYADLLKRLETLKEGPLQKLVLAILRETNYIEELRNDKETFADRSENVHEFIAKAGEWERAHPEGKLSQFLEELSLKSTLDEVDDLEEHVSLMTLHNGKGLEFTAVFLVGMEDDLFPHANSRERYDLLEEERRLCYVGMTRAKERLYFSSATSRFIWGVHRIMHPSRFLREIPKEFIAKVQ